MEKLLWENDATALGDLVKRGEVDPAELVDAAIARCERISSKINAVAERLYDQARERAKNVDRSVPFAGVPFALKDLAISLSGVPIHSGSCLKPLIPDINSTLTDRYLAAGLIPIATSTTPEYGLRLVTETARFGITRNPWNTGHVTGGSSGGAAALVAAGAVPVAHASDGGGSIRVPSACCGLVGLMPSRGRVPLTPDVPEGWYGFLRQHVVARTVRDSAALLDLSAGHDGLAPYVAPPPRGTFAAAAATQPGRLSIGVFRRSPMALPVDAEVGVALDKAVTLSRDAGHQVEEIDLPVLNRDFMADFARCVASAHAGLMRLEAERAGRYALAEVERQTRLLTRFGEMLGAGEAAAALARLQVASVSLLQQTRRFDVVLMPILASPPLPCGGLDPRGADLVAEVLLDRLRLTPVLRIAPLFAKLLDDSLKFTHWPPVQNVTGQPAIALPVHVTAAGLPLGIQAAGRIGGEETLLSFAAQMEEMSGWRTRRAPLDVPR